MLHIMPIQYKIEKNVKTEEFIELLCNSTLGERRPVNEPDRMEQMLRNANLTITARENSKLIGIARSMTDFVYATYLSDLAVSKKYQGKGIGTELIRRTKLSSPKAMLILLSAPAAVEYYPKVGMENHKYAFVLKNIDDLK